MGHRRVREQVAIFERILPHYAEMQRGSRALLERWIDAGTPDRRVARLPELLDGLLSGELWRDELPLNPDERRAIDDTRNVRARVCGSSARRRSPTRSITATCTVATSSSDARQRASRRLGRLDASAHPFASPFVIYQHAVAKLPPAERRAAALRHRDAYLEAWSDDASPTELRRAFVHAIWIAYVVRALNFAHHLDDTAPDAANWSSEIAEFLRRWQHKAAMLDRPDDLIEAVASEVEG